MTRLVPAHSSLATPRGYETLLRSVSALLEEARRSAARAINSILTATYWEIGRRLVEFEQGGQARADYGETLLTKLGSDLTARFGRGFGKSNLYLMRSFYLARQDIFQTVSGKSPARVKTWSPTALAERFPLSWSHYVCLLSLDEPAKRAFYEEEAQRGAWSVRQLDRQLNSMLYERVALSRKKGELLRKAESHPERVLPEEEIKDPYILEFLGLPESHSERDLETALTRRLAEFLLELGYGFTFIARQKRLQIGHESYYLDLLFYHRRLRCLVAIDLKIGHFTHADAGQMNMYLNYLKDRETVPGDAPPIGLILCAEKDDAVARYALGGLTNKVFASRYKLQLPTPKVLAHEIAVERRRLEHRLQDRGS